MPKKLTPEGELVSGVFVNFRLHLENHGCEQCRREYGNIISAITEWINSQSQKEEKHGDEEKGSKETQAGPVKKPSKKKDPLSIFR